MTETPCELLLRNLKPQPRVEKWVLKINGENGFHIFMKAENQLFLVWCYYYAADAAAGMRKENLLLISLLNFYQVSNSLYVNGDAAQACSTEIILGRKVFLKNRTMASVEGRLHAVNYQTNVKCLQFPKQPAFLDYVYATAYWIFKTTSN